MKLFLNLPSLMIRILLIVSLSFLAACSGNKVVVTTDGSADYKTAGQLPPLKKTVNNPSTDAVAQVSPQTEQLTSESDQAITASITQVSGQNVRMSIDAGIDSAWSFLLDSLRGSAVTLQSRNRSANQIEIGCGSVDDGSGDVEQGRWIFNNELIYEYCVLQLDEGGNSTEVSMLDRRGEEVSGADATTVFSKLLNN